MPPCQKTSAPSTLTGSSSNATIGFEAKLWLAADKLRNNMDAEEYKHVVLGLIFLKYISNARRSFRDRRKQTLFINDRKLGPLIGAGVENPSLN